MCELFCRYDEYGRLRSVQNGDHIHQHFWGTSDSTRDTIKVYTSLTGRQGTIRRSVTGSLLRTTSAIGAVKTVTTYDQDTGIFYTIHPNEMKVNIDLCH